MARRPGRRAQRGDRVRGRRHGGHLLRRVPGPGQRRRRWPPTGTGATATTSTCPMVDIHSVGAGGGSIARVRQGALLVGPDSAGSVPGPVCYGRGGHRAHGHRRRRRARLPAGRRASPGAAWSSTSSRRAGPSPARRRRAARASTSTTPPGPSSASSTPTWPTRCARCSPQHGADPRTLALIAYGGGGPVHAWAQARELGIDRVLCPRPRRPSRPSGLLVSDYVGRPHAGLRGQALRRRRRPGPRRWRPSSGARPTPSWRRPGSAPTRWRPTCSRRCATTGRTST